MVSNNVVCGSSACKSHDAPEGPETAQQRLAPAAFLLDDVPILYSEEVVRSQQRAGRLPELDESAAGRPLALREEGLDLDAAQNRKNAFQTADDRVPSSDRFSQAVRSDRRPHHRVFGIGHCGKILAVQPIEIGSRDFAVIRRSPIETADQLSSVPAGNDVSCARTVQIHLVVLDPCWCRSP